MKTPSKALLIAAIVCCCGVLLLFWDPMKSVVFTSTSTIKYDHDRPYYLWVSRGLSTRFDIFVSDDGAYGHAASCTLPSNTTVTAANWLPEGLDIVFSTGHRFFIPKKSFIGGR